MMRPWKAVLKSGVGPEWSRPSLWDKTSKPRKRPITGGIASTIVHMGKVIITRHLKIFGRVQGVGFRAFVTHHANRLGLDGHVRNRLDESVEVLVSGEPSQVEMLIALCREGPPASRVEKVEVSDARVTTLEKGFRHAPTV